MVDSIANESFYGSIGIGAYSIGTYSQVDKTDTEVFEDVFQDALEAVDDKSQEQSVSKIDQSSLGVPAGMQIEGVESTQQVAQSGSSQGSNTSSSDSEDEEYDEMDLNQDGTVTPAEMIIYEMTHGSSQTENAQTSSINSTSLSDALSAYMVA